VRLWLGWTLAAVVAVAILGGLIVLVWLWFVIFGGWGWPEWFHSPWWPG
jgi:hypothetical protein